MKLLFLFFFSLRGLLSYENDLDWVKPKEMYGQRNSTFAWAWAWACLNILLGLGLGLAFNIFLSLGLSLNI